MVVFLPDVSVVTCGNSLPEAWMFIHVIFSSFAVLTLLLDEPFRASLSFANQACFLFVFLCFFVCFYSFLKNIFYCYSVAVRALVRRRSLLLSTLAAQGSASGLSSLELHNNQPTGRRGRESRPQASGWFTQKKHLTQQSF